MKKIIAFFLCFVMLISAVACGSETAEEKKTENDVKETESVKEKETVSNKPLETKEVETKEEKKEAVYHTVTDPISFEKLNAAIPVANSSMTTDQLRQICVDFFHLSMSFTYVPNQDYNYVVESQNLDRVLPEGQLTGGVPYITKGNGNLYRLMDHLDPATGILDVSSYLSNYKAFGNACSGGATWGWARAVNSVSQFQWTWGMTQANGYLKVGPYEYDTTLKTIGKEDGEYGSPEICKANGEQIMFQSYAATHKADGIVAGGHVRMVSDEPHVKYNPDGSINGKESYLICSDQICYNTSEAYARTQSDGTPYRIAGGYDKKYTFNELFKDSYIPFTFAEFLGTDPVEDATTDFSHKADTITPIQLNGSILYTNYILSDVYFNVKDSSGTVVFSYRRSMESFQMSKFSFSGKSPTPMLNRYADGNHTIELSVQLGNGTRPVFYSGTLVAA